MKGATTLPFWYARNVNQISFNLSSTSTSYDTAIRAVPAKYGNIFVNFFLQERLNVWLNNQQSEKERLKL